jgi:hypothetical protein
LLLQFFPAFGRHRPDGAVLPWVGDAELDRLVTRHCLAKPFSIRAERAEDAARRNLGRESERGFNGLSQAADERVRRRAVIRERAGEERRPQRRLSTLDELRPRLLERCDRGEVATLRLLGRFVGLANEPASLLPDELGLIDESALERHPDGVAVGRLRFDLLLDRRDGLSKAATSAQRFRLGEKRLNTESSSSPV